MRYWLAYEQRVTPSQRVDPHRVHGRLVHVGLAAAYQAAANGPGSWSRGAVMSMFAGAAREAINVYVDRDPITVRQRESALAEVERVLRVLPIPAMGAILGVELPFRMTVNDVVIIGAIDLLLRTAVDGVHTRDWKTGAVPTEIVVHPQLGTYFQATRERFPWARSITVGLFPTRALNETMGTFNAETLDYVLGRLVEKYHQSVDTAQLVGHGELSIVDAYPTNPDSQCSRCDYRSYCPLFAGVDLPVRDITAVAVEKDRIHRLIN
jgi:hypothetical protein